MPHPNAFIYAIVHSLIWNILIFPEFAYNCFARHCCLFLISSSQLNYNFLEKRFPAWFTAMVRVCMSRLFRDLVPSNSWFSRGGKSVNFMVHCLCTIKKKKGCGCESNLFKMKIRRLTYAQHLTLVQWAWLLVHRVFSRLCCWRGPGSLAWPMQLPWVYGKQKFY